MFRSIKAILFSVIMVAMFASCEKETSVEKGVDTSGGSQSGTAVYTLDGEPLPCTTPLVSGNYVVNTALALDVCIARDALEVSRRRRSR